MSTKVDTSTIECSKCGKCCWDWREDNFKEKCEWLDENDKVTCLIFDKWEEYERPECRLKLKLHQSVDLPEDCTYVKAWLDSKEVSLKDGTIKIN